MNTPTNNSNCRILVIDDNRSIHDDFRKIFLTAETDSSKVDDLESQLFGDALPREERAAIEVDSAFQGREGLDLVRKALKESHPYPVAFVDMRMPPGWDGLETVSRIWKEYPDLQVVICTAYSDYTWEEMLQKVGHPDQLALLKKPFRCQDVVTLAQKLIDKWQQSHEPKPDSESANNSP